jgi:hypothetical protein
LLAAAAYTQLPTATADASAAVLTADAGEWVEVEDPDTSTYDATTSSHAVQRPVTTPSLEFPTILIVIAILCVLALLWWGIAR